METPLGRQLSMWICTSSPRALPYAPQLSPTGTRSAPKTMSKANAFYAQSGGVTPVINASACGVIETAAQYKDLIGKVYAGRNGIVGALREDQQGIQKSDSGTDDNPCRCLWVLPLQAA